MTRFVDGVGDRNCRGGFVEDGGECGAGVFDVEIEIAGEERFLAEERAAEIGFAFDVDAGAGFDVLGEEFGENDLLGEKFGADGDVGLDWCRRRKKERRGRQEEENAAHGWECLRDLAKRGIKQREKFNTEDGERSTEIDAEKRSMR